MEGGRVRGLWGLDGGGACTAGPQLGRLTYGSAATVGQFEARITAGLDCTLANRSEPRLHMTQSQTNVTLLL